MNLTNKTVIKDLLKKHGARPEKYFGQHFILSKKALTQMVMAAEIKKNDTIIEIGPGLGTLTQELAKIPHSFSKGGEPRIIAVEKDPKMINILKETLADYKNIKIVQADARLSILRIDSLVHKMGITKEKGEYKIVANLPYNVATFLIRSWLEMKNPPKQMVLMIQKEVAQRICAKPRLRAYSAEATSAAKAGQGYGGQAHMNLLAVSTQFLAIAKIIGYVPAEAFWPKPKVDSAIIKIVPRIFNSASFVSDRKQMMQVVKAGFSQPRKQLIGNLAKKLNVPKEKLLEIFKKLNIRERVRAENLSLEQWISLSTSLHLTI